MPDPPPPMSAPGAPPQSPYPNQPYPAYGTLPPNWAPSHAPRPMNWDAMCFIFRMIGFLLLVVGTIVIVAWVEPSGSCYNFTTTPSCTINSSYAQGAANAIITGKILFALGAFFLGAGAGMKLHWALRYPPSGNPEETKWARRERMYNYGLIALSILLLVWILGGAALAAPPVP